MLYYKYKQTRRCAVRTQFLSFIPIIIIKFWLSLWTSLPDHALHQIYQLKASHSAWIAKGFHSYWRNSWASIDSHAVNSCWVFSVEEICRNSEPILWTQDLWTTYWISSWIGEWQTNSNTTQHNSPFIVTGSTDIQAMKHHRRYDSSPSVPSSYKKQRVSDGPGPCCPPWPSWPHLKRREDWCSLGEQRGLPGSRWDCGSTARWHVRVVQSQIRK